MLRNRLYMLALVLATAGLLLYSGEPLLLAALAAQGALVIAMGLLLRHDAAVLHTQIRVRPGGQDGKPLPATVTVRADGPMFVTRSVILDVESYNTMFDIRTHRRFLLPITGQTNTYEISGMPDACGRLTVSCRSIRVLDLLRLFSAPIEPFAPVQSVVHPHRAQAQVEISRATIGAPRADGLMQNRKGRDQSEMYDIREYVPGDDIRAIHWKLSGKTDELILRQASDPSHYDIVLLPDFGHRSGSQPADAAECTAAAAYGAAIGAQLVRQNVGFCMAIPGAAGLELCEVRSARDYQQVVARWLSTPAQEESGDGLRYFLMEHLESQFTRLILLSAGTYSPELTKLNGQIGVTVVSAVRGAKVQHTALGYASETVTVPAEASDEAVCRLLC